MDLFAAEEAFTQPGFINRVDVVVTRSEDVTTVADRIAAKLPPGLMVAAPAQRKADLHKVMQSMQMVLRAVGLLGLAAAFLIAFNRLATVFDERSWQLGVMRASGVRAGTVWWELLKESMIVGALGVALGIPLGIGLARILLPFIATTTALSSKLAAPDASLVVRTSSLLLGATLGLTTAFVAAARPAWRAARVNVADTIRGRGTEYPRVGSRAMWMMRAVVLAATLCAVAMQLAGGSPAWGLAATAAILVTAALGARPLVEVLGTMLVRRASDATSSGPFAIAGLARKPHRTALTVATLGVGFGTVIWTWIVAQSFQQSVIDVVDGVLHGDLAVSSAQMGSGLFETPLHEGVLSDISAIEGVRSVVGEQIVDWQYKSGPIVVNSFDNRYVDGEAFLRWRLIGDHAPDIWRDFAKGTAVIVSTNFLFHLGASVGDILTLDTPTGPLAVRIGGVLATLISPRGTIIMSRELYKSHWHDPHILHALVATRSEYSAAAVSSGIAAALGHQHRLKILSLHEFAAWTGDQVGRAFAGIYALSVLILVVVLFGAADTLGAAVLERRRELAQLRATGVRASHVRRIVLVEALLLGTLGLALALAIGIALGVFWVRGTFPYMLGWVLDLHIPYRDLALICVLSLGTCLVAAWLPARRAGRLEPAAALRYE